MSKKFLAVILSAVMAAGTLAGCGNASADTSDAPAQEESAPAEEAAGDEDQGG